MRKPRSLWGYSPVTSTATKPAMTPRLATMAKMITTTYWGMARNHLYSGFHRSRCLG